MQNMSPNQCLQLIKATEKIVSQRDKGPNLLSHMDPSKILGKNFGLLTRNDINCYCSNLKEELYKLAKENHSFILDLIKIFREPIDRMYQKMEKRFGADLYNTNFQEKEFNNLVNVMKDKDMLPAITFVFDRKQCDRLLSAVIRTLSTNRQTLFDSKTQHICLLDVRKSIESLKEDNIIMMTPLLLRGLELGVAVHHAGAPIDYLKEVERLFRSR